MKVNNPNKLYSRTKLEKIMDTPNHGVDGIFKLVSEHNIKFNDDLGCYTTVVFIPQTSFIRCRTKFMTGELEI